MGRPVHSTGIGRKDRSRKLQCEIDTFLVDKNRQYEQPGGSVDETATALVEHDENNIYFTKYLMDEER